MFVLVVTSYIWGYNGGGPVTQFQEFTNKGRCEMVADRLTKWPATMPRGSSGQTLAFCVEK